MKPTDYAEIADALGISTDEAAGLEAEWRRWTKSHHDKQEGVMLKPNLVPR
jgi:hypothetical protein